MFAFSPTLCSLAQRNICFFCMARTNTHTWHLFRFVANGFWCECMNSFARKMATQEHSACRCHRRRHRHTICAAIDSRKNHHVARFNGVSGWYFRLAFAILTIKCKKRIIYIWIFGYSLDVTMVFWLILYIYIYTTVMPTYLLDYFLLTPSMCRLQFGQRDDIVCHVDGIVSCECFSIKQKRATTTFTIILMMTVKILDFGWTMCGNRSVPNYIYIRIRIWRSKCIDRE